MKISNNKNWHTTFIVISIALMILVTAACIFYFRRQVSLLPEFKGEPTTYKHHYAFICADPTDNFYNSIYSYANQTAQMDGDYLEFMGKNLAVHYTKNELMEIAIDADVDGIVVEADENGSMTSLIDQANSKGIPVITIGTDDTSSKRQSYVGFGYYDLGQKYGKQILRSVKDEKQEVLVLMSPDAADSSQNIIFQGMKDTIDKSDNSKYFSLKTLAIPDTSKFGAEEKISSLMMDDTTLPPMIVCLNEIDTTCACQALVDYNRVGDTQIYGFYTNSTILSAIQKKIITATVTVNTSQMGKYCIEALGEYEDYGYVNEYMPADIEVITADNVNNYIDEETSEAADEEK